MLINLATSEANHLVTSGLLRKGCFVRLKSFQANSVKGKKYVAYAGNSQRGTDSIGF